MERRNLYRILHVQPEAPAEVIKAAYRALMSSMRMHPDLGGDTAVAARLNAAYTTLSDPASRRAYDLSLRRPARGAAASDGPAGAKPGSPRPETAPAPLDARNWLSARACPLCRHPFNGCPGVDDRCGHCDSPLRPAPERLAGESAELIGRRRSSRHARNLQGWLRLNGAVGELAVQLRDLSLQGVSMWSPLAVPAGTTVRVTTPLFDAIALVVGCHASGARQVLHAQLLTLQLVRDGKGVLVSVKV